MEPNRADVDRVSKALKARPERWRAAPGHGSRATRRWIVTLPDGRTAFAKIAALDESAEWLRTEAAVYGQVRGPFLPGLIAWHDDGERPVLVIEDLSGAEWPPPWGSDRIDAVLATLTEVAATTPPHGLPSTEWLFDMLDRWDEIAAGPEPFLGLGLCSAAWLEASLPRLKEASVRADLSGDALLHLDVRSDNLCFRNRGAVLVDWNWASVGNPLLDVAGWLPSLQAEGGPAPEEILPQGGGEIAALVAGYLACQAAKPPISTATHVRPLQLSQARTALPWAARALGLPPPG